MLSDDEFRQLLFYLDRPWSGYRKVRKGVKKRIRKHMADLGCRTMEQYCIVLSRNRSARADCETRLWVTISRFYRDQLLWREMTNRFLPALADRFSPPIRIWSAGCACGEEPFSLAMAWNQLGRSVPLDLLATDAAMGCLARAREGVYGKSSLKNIPKALIGQYFQLRRGGRQFVIQADRLPAIRWRQHDVVTNLDEPESFHMILLRNNLLTYYGGIALRSAFRKIVTRLVPGGFLVTGSHERLPDIKTELIRQDSCPWVYRLSTDDKGQIG